ncbi:unnamed protein product [Lepeophtheirus salmonis]|uniref:(salmon louse) hypothetical protein n=1 Tax=Lepeophtheirus salmonis TaxID=72036 RepID=A0A7R8CU88_LEPSM|nr:unnamed protein product [Lepeophtheirus salmonis]CAF2897856.1 unnamed protein product [Lepeophtheirus salmonis]
MNAEKGNLYKSSSYSKRKDSPYLPLKGDLLRELKCFLSITLQLFLKPLNYKEDFLERSVPLSQMEDSYIPYRETDDQLDYDEFPENPTFFYKYILEKNLGEASYQKEPVFQKPHQKTIP